MIQLNKEHLQIIFTHAQSSYPEECCGVIIGQKCDRTKTVVEVIPTENDWNPDTAKYLADDEIFYSRQRRYSIPPREMLRLQKSVRERNLSIIGIFHSHPDYPAIPSEFDRNCAWQEYSYIIVSVEKGRARDINSWLVDDNYQFEQEVVEVEGGWGAEELRS